MLNDGEKIDRFSKILKAFKDMNENICFIIRADHLYIQVMDMAHIGLCECCLNFDWFDNKNELINTMKSIKNKEDIQIIINSALFCKIISDLVSPDEQHITFDFSDENDTIEIIATTYTTVEKSKPTAAATAKKPVKKTKAADATPIEYETKKSIEKSYTISRIIVDNEIMNIPETDYVVNFQISTKTIADIFKQMSLFGQTVQIKCDDTTLDISSSEAQNGEMQVNIPAENLNDFAIDEDGSIDLKFNLTYLMKHCIDNTLNEAVEFYMGDDVPMKINYILDYSSADTTKKSVIAFYIAPKSDEI